MPIIETRSLPSGAVLDLEVHRSPGNIAGVVAHWGVKHETGEIKEHLARLGIPQDKLSGDTGFLTIYRQAEGISRSQAIEDELRVATIVATQTIAANEWEIEDVDSLVLGSGVPVVDDETIDDYAKEVAKRVGLRNDIETHNTYAACTSGAHEFLRTLTKQSMKGKKVLVMGMEGITTLTPDLEHADPFSIQVFSNGAAGVGIIPGEDITVFETQHKVVEDRRGALAAKMQYERLLDQNDPSIWQEREGAHMIRYPRPESGKTLYMDQTGTSGLFLLQNVPFIAELYKKHKENHPTSNIVYIVAHHASKPMNEGVDKRLRKQGIAIETPWVVSDGNSSAATALIAHNRLLGRAEPNTRIMMIGYGAGASFDGGVIEYRQRSGLS